MANPQKHFSDPPSPELQSAGSVDEPAEAIPHYDLSNEFFALWLDREMTYSGAMFEPGDTLETAQNRKLDFHVACSRAAGRERVLDVGCGWGSLLRRMVLHHGVEKAVGLVLNAAQAERILADSIPGIEVRLESWRDHRPEEPYGGIVSIGAFEHFADRGLTSEDRIAIYREFFLFCRQNLKPGGHLSLQTIAYAYSQDPVDPFVSRVIFPRSDLPLSWEILRAAEGLFDLIALRNDRRDYMKTCRRWLKNLNASRPRATELVGEPTVRQFEKYLQIAAGAFRLGNLSLLRLTFRRIDLAVLGVPTEKLSPYVVPDTGPSIEGNQ